MVVEMIPFPFPRAGRMVVRDDVPGFGAEFHYQNGWSASVARNTLTGGNARGLFSLAIIDQATGALIPCPEILGEEGEPLGWLTGDEVDALLHRVMNLPQR